MSETTQEMAVQAEERTPAAGEAEPFFINESTMTVEDFSALHAGWERYRSPMKAIRTMQRVCFALPGVVLVLLGGSSFWTSLTGGEGSFGSAVLGILLIGMGLLLVFWPFGKDRGKRSWKRYPDKGRPLRLTFESDGFYMTTNQVGEYLLYSAIRAILEDDRVFLLFFENRTAYILHKDGFLTGDADGFRDFLRQRTGLTIETF